MGRSFTINWLRLSLRRGLSSCRMGTANYGPGSSSSSPLISPAGFVSLWGGALCSRIATAPPPPPPPPGQNLKRVIKNFLRPEKLPQTPRPGSRSQVSRGPAAAGGLVPPQGGTSPGLGFLLLINGAGAGSPGTRRREKLWRLHVPSPHVPLQAPWLLAPVHRPPGRAPSDPAAGGSPRLPDPPRLRAARSRRDGTWLRTGAAPGPGPGTRHLRGPPTGRSDSALDPQRHLRDPRPAPRSQVRSRAG